MMRFTIENEKTSIEVDTLGAELKSLYSKKLCHEFLWQPGHEIWPGQATNLFPNVGMVSRERVLVDNKEYPFIQHGFARNMEFSLCQRTESKLLFELSSNPQTRKYFPFQFRFQIEYRLEENVVYQGYRVLNDDSRPFSFGVGAHTGFYCPILVSENPADYAIKFETEETLTEIVRNEESLCTGEERLFLKNSDTLNLHDGLFNNGAFILKGFKSEYLTLFSKKSRVYVKVGFKGFPYVTFWSRPGSLYFICIEPWCGLPDYINSDHNIFTKPGNNRLDKSEVFYREQSFEIG